MVVELLFALERLFTHDAVQLGGVYVIAAAVAAAASRLPGVGCTKPSKMFLTCASEHHCCDLGTSQS